MRVLEDLRQSVRKAAFETRFDGRFPAVLLPDFLGIGAQKAGTTWLCENLRRHPGIFLPARKELHYFNSRTAQYNLLYYSRFFWPGLGRVKGEITPAYSALPSGMIRRIHALKPSLKVLFGMRNPVERAWSHALHDLCTRRGRPYDAVPEGEFLGHFASPESIERGSFMTVLNNWLTVFDEAQFFMYFFEEIRERPRDLLARVFRHLGVTAEVDWSLFPVTEKFLVSLQIPMPEKFRSILEDRWRDEIRRMHDFFGDPVKPWLV